MAATKRRSVRQAATRQRSVYAEPDTDEDFDYDDAQPERDPVLEQPPPRKRQRTEPRPQRSQRRRSRPSIAKAAKPPKAPVQVVRKPTGFTGPSDKITPNWTSLPVGILREVFEYACRPSKDQNTVPRRAHLSTPAWLLKAARVCSAFATPALEAYYQSPALPETTHPHQLLELLKDDSRNKYLQYNRKVKSLIIDVRTLAYTATGKPLFDISTLLAELPQLHHLEVFHPRDAPPFRPLPIQKWHYPPHLFQSMQESVTRLRSWRWTRDMVATNDSTILYDLMAETHTSKSFQSLEKLVICGYSFNNNSAEPEASEDENLMAPGLATSIALLPNLKDLTFVSCDVIMDKFLERLPDNLEHLELTNCLELTSDMLRNYLAAAGSHLRELTLNHNPALNLTFITNLRNMCPKLETLKMDFHCYSERLNSNDAEPLYTELLGAGDVPSWPITLRQLELIHVQRCSAEAAQNLFRSLVDGANGLLDLRRLVIQAHIDIPWRDRAGFRDQWTECLQRVYSRKGEPPSPFMGSLRQIRLLKAAENDGRVVTYNTRTSPGDKKSVTRRKAAFVNVTPAKHDGDTDMYSDSSPVERPQRRSQRVVQNQASRSASSGGESDSEDEVDTAEDVFVQGLCDVVDIRIDNQRPREMQFTEGDFLDGELSGDEDWDEDAENGEEDRYAW